MSKNITLPDGTKCYTGPTCKKHGSHAQKNIATAKVEQLKTQLNALFDTLNTPKTNVNPPKPEWWNDYCDRRLGDTKEIFQRFGLQEANVPTYHEAAMQYGYIDIPTGDPETKLIATTDGTYYKSGEKYYLRAWMYKHGKPVAMLRFATYPQNYTPPEGTYQHIESVVCDIEVKPEHRGKKYGIEIIRQVEKNILAGRELHSGAGYTPEGRQAFGHILPHTHEAKTDRSYRKDFASGKIPEATYKTMNFVHDWDKLTPMA